MRRPATSSEYHLISIELAAVCCTDARHTGLAVDIAIVHERHSLGIWHNDCTVALCFQQNRVRSCARLSPAAGRVKVARLAIKPNASFAQIPTHSLREDFDHIVSLLEDHCLRKGIINHIVFLEARNFGNGILDTLGHPQWLLRHDGTRAEKNTDLMVVP